MTNTRGWKTWAALVALVFVAAAQSWGAVACQLRHYTYHPGGDYTCGQACVPPEFACTDSRFPIPQAQLTLTERECSGAYQRLYCYYEGYCCGNQCQSDSVTNGGIITECEPDLASPTGYSKYICPGDLNCSSCQKEPCSPERDTTLFGCSDFGNGKSGLYRLACKSINGAVVSCNGKTDVNIETDGTLVREQDGTCAQNGIQNGIFGGASADSAQQQTADCFATIGSKCFMKDRNSGNTYTCECDGSCDYAIRQLALGLRVRVRAPAPGRKLSYGIVA